MAYAKKSVVIHKSVEEVFHFILDGENNKCWRPSVINVQKTSSNDLGVGTIYKQGMKGPFGRRISGDYEITKCEKNKVISFQVISGPARPTGNYDFESNGSETKVTFTLSFHPTGFAKLMDPMINKQMQVEVANLSNIKTCLEK